MRVVVRTDASLEIGSGHVMRCLTLAQGLRDVGGDVMFVCRAHPGHMGNQIAARGYKVGLMPAATLDKDPSSQHAHWLGATNEKDAAETRATMKAFGFTNADWLIVDHYAIDSRWEAAMRPVVSRILAIDDLADRRHDCDILLDQNLVANFETRYQGLLPAGAVVFVGPKFALLQPEYADLHKQAQTRSEPAQRILIYFGAADHRDLTTWFLSSLLQLRPSDFAIDVVANNSHPNFSGLKTLSERDPRVRLHGDLPTLAPLMAAADLAIGASGATSWERLCLKLPAIVVTLADNQRNVAAELHRRGLAHWLGDAATFEDLAWKELLRTALTPRDHDFSGVEEIDGKGMVRVRRAMMDF